MKQGRRLVKIFKPYYLSIDLSFKHFNPKKGQRTHETFTAFPLTIGGTNTFPRSTRKVVDTSYTWIYHVLGQADHR